MSSPTVEQRKSGDWWKHVASNTEELEPHADLEGRLHFHSTLAYFLKTQPESEEFFRALACADKARQDYLARHRENRAGLYEDWADLPNRGIPINEVPGRQVPGSHPGNAHPEHPPRNTSRPLGLPAHHATPSIVRRPLANQRLEGTPNVLQPQARAPNTLANFHPILPRVNTPANRIDNPMIAQPPVNNHDLTLQEQIQLQAEIEEYQRRRIAEIQGRQSTTNRPQFVAPQPGAFRVNTPIYPPRRDIPPQPRPEHPFRDARQPQLGAPFVYQPMEPEAPWYDDQDTSVPKIVRRLRTALNANRHIEPKKSLLTQAGLKLDAGKTYDGSDNITSFESMVIAVIQYLENYYLLGPAATNEQVFYLSTRLTAKAEIFYRDQLLPQKNEGAVLTLESVILAL
ncbi:hypothetical protein SISSUDRAFT_1068160, partial [Sistotremastrum suecicum HHB10207 ss-3]